MPQKGWKTILIKEEYDVTLKRIYEKRKHELLDLGIRTYNGFIQDIVRQWVEIESKMDVLREKYGEDLKKLGIYTIPALLDTSIQLLMRDLEAKKSELHRRDTG